MLTRNGIARMNTPTTKAVRGLGFHCSPGTTVCVGPSATSHSAYTHPCFIGDPSPQIEARAPIRLLEKLGVEPFGL